VTILGAHLCAPDRALIWADTQIFRDGEPAGHVCKMAINPLAIIAGVGAGRTVIARAADRAVTAATSFDELIEILPGVLRLACSEYSTEYAQAQPRCTYLTVGFSHRFGRLAGFVFEEADYEPSLVSSFALPNVGGLASLHPAAPEDITGLAQQQIGELQRGLPGATGGALVIAVVTPHEITTRASFDLRTGSGGLRPQVLNKGVS
jgi:hypothetical protein